MNRKSIIILLILAICLLGFFLWKTLHHETSDSNRTDMSGEIVSPYLSNKSFFTEVAKESPNDLIDSQEPAGVPLTEKTLSGTAWKKGKVDIVFLADGRWQMNGRICARWKVEGSRIKIYDDKGEVHYLDIAGNHLEFNGERLGRKKI